MSQNGGLIRSSRVFKVGAVLEILRRDRERSARARVVWISPEPSPRGFDLGFEILDETGFWEINFPADRWSGKTPQEAHTG